MGAIRGKDYIDRINQLQSEVWIDGKRVEGKISEHPAFRGVLKSQAKLYDLQHDASRKELLTYPSPTSGERVGISFMMPKTKRDLKKRRIMVQEWAKTNAGMMGRSPDYMNTVLVSFVASQHILEGNENCFPENLISLYEHARENDLSFTHTFINPQFNRAPLHFLDEFEHPIAAKVIDETNEGIIIKGAKLLATQGGLTDEIIVYSTPSPLDKSYAFAFSIPSNTKGLKFICRQSFCSSQSKFNYPLSSRFEENDSLVVFDHVLVPWERVFYYNNIQVANAFSTKGPFTPFALHQVASRQIVKLEFILGVAQLIVDSINTSEFQHVQEKVSDIIIALETMKAFLIASEAEAKKGKNGIIIPAVNPLYTGMIMFQRLYPKLTEILQLLGASGMINIPTEEDFESEIKDDLDLYLQAKTRDAKERVKLFRLAWDLCMSPFGTRQTLYERFFFGDPIRLTSSLFINYNKKTMINRVEGFLGEY
ncbi:4-hydroxyphenylacetate 3-monooxygenase, oxygenase component [Alkalihalobacterium chitinilyticum]|uniref:4-hydroxyphenylacetate 3-monooxygenase, oxygenase component n=1 Tax=Alkalihalobacterium chitinilyticum TaxID=2980103 RepID=A0ABT5VD33_9BACI|nr:4-hydroxyphenylacetate 3-monooxygenase, oxygenase component [Alkalihalobacterium chitinilyticum]MDE5413362.1 4-hydroxyphenylacetate 3-monooxygenase, oxygenase component [Alkalihalobacterium chitinilyticum]